MQYLYLNQQCTNIWLYTIVGFVQYLYLQNLTSLELGPSSISHSVLWACIRLSFTLTHLLIFLLSYFCLLLGCTFVGLSTVYLGAFGLLVFYFSYELFLLSPSQFLRISKTHKKFSLFGGKKILYRRLFLNFFFLVKVRPTQRLHKGQTL